MWTIYVVFGQEHLMLGTLDDNFDGTDQEFRREGWTEKCSAVRFCLGSGLFGSYNSD